MKSYFALTAMAGLNMAQAALMPVFLQDSAKHLLGSTSLDPARVLTHGCWCAKLDSTNDDSFLGGPKALDELDALCKNYLQKRSCLTRLSGGSCENHDLSGQYKFDVSKGSIYSGISDPAQCSGSGCAADLCRIDAEFVAAANKFVYDEIQSQAGLQEATEVDSVGTCDIPTQVGGEKRCEGTAPDVRVVGGSILVWFSLWARYQVVRRCFSFL